MKKSRIAKLALMGASITALAATLTTSTYAWYVSNKVATVKSGLGHTGSAGADGSVLLSWKNPATDSTAVWTKELTFNDTANGAADLSGVKLTPVHYSATNPSSTAAPGFYGITSTGAQAATAMAANLTTDAGSYMQFVIYAKTESDTPITVTPSIIINNTTASQTGLAQNAYVGTGATGSPVAAGTNFIYNCLDALYVKQTATASTGSGNAATAGAVTAETYVAASKSGVRGTSTVTTGWTNAGSGNAHDYFKAVSGATSVWATEPACADADDTDNNITAGTLSQIVLTTTPLAITYVVFLDGGDVDCFNSCAGQDISFELKLTVNE